MYVCLFCPSRIHRVCNWEKNVNILSLVDLVAHVLKTLFHLAPVRSLQTLHFSPSTHSQEHICVNLCSLLQIPLATIAELF